MLVDTSDITEKADLVSLKTDVEKLVIDILKTVPNDLNNLKSKVNKTDIVKIKSVPVYLKKLSDVVDIDVIKETVYEQLFTNVNDSDTSKLFKKTDYNTKILKIEDKYLTMINLLLLLILIN